MKVNTVMEVISAAHVSRFVGSPFEQRGGITCVAPPGHLKSTIIENSLSLYADTLSLSDLNVTSLNGLRNALVSGRYTSLAFGELEKLYERNPGSARNIIGHIRAMIDEGFDKMSFSSQEMIGAKARILIVAGITPAVYQQRWQEWLDNGWARRFLWSHWRLADEEIIVQAIRKWNKLAFGKISSSLPSNRSIPYIIKNGDSTFLEDCLSDQPSKETPYILFKKIYCVLVWRYGVIKAKKIIYDFSESLHKGGATLYV